MTNKKVKKIEATKPTLSAQYSTFTRKRKVAAYARVSTAKEEQENSFDAQVSYYTQKIQANPEWVFVEVYSDEGITGTNTKKREGFNRMIEDALAGKIDLILTKSVSRFARNTLPAWSPSGSSRRKVWRFSSRRRTFTPSMPRANYCLRSCPRLHKKKQGRFRRTPHGVEESPLRTERSASVIPISSVTTKDPTGSL